MDVTHLSRHFLRLQASHVAWLPGPPPGPPDADGVTTAHKLLAVGAYVEDVQVGYVKASMKPWRCVGVMLHVQGGKHAAAYGGQRPPASLCAM